ncbi:MAG: KpsF/GutQ family sugar-phosphate isomerase [Candidatus Kapaibacterium sp.]|jgi:arabinose-5-phosphate isomerase
MGKQTRPEHSSYFEIAKETFRIESGALARTIEHLRADSFDRACELLLGVAGRVIVTGMGKSGHIARKIASTLSSTGTPAFFLHPGEAAHGDLGILQSGDVILILSKSGESDELFTILPALASIQVPIIAITASPHSKLVDAANSSNGVVLLITVAEEACPHDLAPTASTTASLVLGDALAMALLHARNFTSADFAKLHPAGALGRRLTISVRDLMSMHDKIPKVKPDATIAEVMLEMSAKRFGATSVVGASGLLEGIITDGDLRRFFLANPSADMQAHYAFSIMTRTPRTITQDALAIDALHLMENTTPNVMHLLVLDDKAMFVGIVHLHDIVRAGIS